MRLLPGQHPQPRHRQGWDGDGACTPRGRVLEVRGSQRYGQALSRCPGCFPAPLAPLHRPGNPSATPVQHQPRHGAENPRIRIHRSKQALGVQRACRFWEASKTTQLPPSSLGEPSAIWQQGGGALAATPDPATQSTLSQGDGWDSLERVTRGGSRQDTGTEPGREPHATVGWGWQNAGALASLAHD